MVTQKGGMAYLVETDIVGVLTEALTAEIKVILADQSAALGADTATSNRDKYTSNRKMDGLPLVSILSKGMGTGAPDVRVDHGSKSFRRDPGSPG